MLQALKTTVLNTPILNILNKDIKCAIYDKLFCEIVLMEIRGAAISYASHKKKQDRNRGQKLLKQIEQLKMIII